MKLKQLRISRLHGCYNYNVEFNHDVTFIYGANGCGKTTVLNITEAIITGQLFKLFGYSFSDIELQYTSIANNAEYTILIKRVASEPILEITFNNNIFNLHRLNSEISQSARNRESKFYFDHYSFLLQIRDTFNYVYLPLDRASGADEREDIEYYPLRRDRERYIGDATTSRQKSQDIAIQQIELLIYRRCSLMNAQLARISDSFRNGVLKSALVSHADINTEAIIRNAALNPSIIDDLQETKKKYLQILADLDLITDEERTKHAEFFESLVDSYARIRSKKEADPINFLVKFSEIERIKKMVELAEEIEKKKASVRKPINLFLNTMNSFIYNEDDGKELKIDATGKVYFTTKYTSKHISIQHLSSGEKQLVIFFANLIFNVKNNTPGIFVVDEPELSLHLSWQQVFVEKTLGINNKIQLIFATHAPEIIGKRRDKMYRLEKEYID